MLTSVLSPSVCASCRLCCNFQRSSAWETPVLEPRCVELLRSMDVPLEDREDGGLTLALQFDSSSVGELALCPLLDSSSGCRLPRELRPLECRLWPLRLMRLDSGELGLAFYSACPGLASVSREALMLLARSLYPELLAHLAQCPACVRCFHPAYSLLCRFSDLAS